jgi:hypothetical protein
MKVTLATMLLHVPGQPTKYGVFQGEVKRDRSRQKYFDCHRAKQVGTLTHEGRATADDYYRMARQFATREYPAFCWNQETEEARK